VSSQIGTSANDKVMDTASQPTSPSSPRPSKLKRRAESRRRVETYTAQTSFDADSQYDSDAKIDWADTGVFSAEALSKVKSLKRNLRRLIEQHKVTKESFTIFQRLPVELRLRIFKIYLSQPRVIPVGMLTVHVPSASHFHFPEVHSL